jgi:N-methylhydantoinase A/oxoprolinase/acetone carboxylase beta subunit
MVGFHTGEWFLSKIYNFDELNSGFKRSGPAVIESIDSTIMIPPRTNATYNKFGTIVIDVNKIIKVKYNERF